MRKTLVAVTALLLLIPVAATAQNNPPVADAGEDQSVYVGQSTLLEGTASDPDGNPILFWLWTVESGPAGGAPPISDDGIPDPTFLATVAGDYLLSLVVSDGALWSEPDFVTVHVLEILPLEAVIDVDVSSGPAPLTVHFDGSQTTFDPYFGPLTFNWSFGNGERSSEESPTTTYTSPGVYTVILTVYDGLDQTDTDSISISVGEPQPAWSEASVVGIQPASASKGLNCLLGLLIPMGAVLLWKRLRKR